MKAIILAAGRGSRLKSFTDKVPKCMVQYRGKPILDYTLKALRSCNINEIVIVKGYLHDTFSVPGTREFLNEDFDSTNMVYTLFCAESALEGDLIICYADIIFRAEVLKALIASPADLAVCIDKDWRQLWEKRMSNPLSDAETLKLDEQGFIRELGQKPRSYEEIEGQYMGLIKISAPTLKRVRDFYHSLDPSVKYDGRELKQMYMTTFLQLIIERLMPVKAVPVHGGWIEIDSPEDLDLDFNPA